MPAPNGNNTGVQPAKSALGPASQPASALTAKTRTELKVSAPGSRLNELGITLPAPPVPLGAYVESSQAGSLLFLSGTLPVVDRKLAISGRLGDSLSVKDGREAARIAALNALAVAQAHLGDINRLKNLIKLTVLVATTEQFTEHASVADGALDLFV